MKSRIIGILVVLALLTISCGETPPFTLAITPQPGRPTVDLAVLKLLLTQAAQRVPGLPKDYFPIDTGRSWNYQITLGTTTPLYYRETAWPISDTKVTVYSERGIYRPSIKENHAATFTLSIRVKGPALKQGPLQYPLGAELNILEDGLGIYEEAKQVFWAVIKEGDMVQYQVHEVITYPPDSFRAPQNDWGSWSDEEGWSMRLVFFGSKPGISIGLGENPREMLTFAGVDTDITGYQGQKLLHFHREVEPAKDNSTRNDAIGRGFTEDTWFAKDEGMVQLVQKIGGETSMTWQLVIPPIPGKNVIPASFSRNQ